MLLASLIILSWIWAIAGGGSLFISLFGPMMAHGAGKDLDSLVALTCAITLFPACMSGAVLAWTWYAQGAGWSSLLWMLVPLLPLAGVPIRLLLAALP